MRIVKVCIVKSSFANIATCGDLAHSNIINSSTFLFSFTNSSLSTLSSTLPQSVNESHIHLYEKWGGY